jgi:hypothetical protein
MLEHAREWGNDNTQGEKGAKTLGYCTGVTHALQ